MNAAPSPVRANSRAATIRLPYWLREFGQIRGAALATLACLIVCAGGIVASGRLQDDARERMLLVQHARERAYAHYAQVGQEKADIRKYQPIFQALRARGLVGEENRLAWADAIRQAQLGYKLPALSYEIAPQQPLRSDPPVDLGDYQLRASRMNLHLSLLHEIDLFNFLGELRLHGYYTVQDCAIKRLAASPEAGAAPTLGADCTLNWITMAPTTATPAAAAPLAGAAP